MIDHIFRTYPYAVQFWGYEVGNVVAALAATGGLASIWALARAQDGGIALGQAVDFVVPVALAVLIALVSVGARLLRAFGKEQLVPVLNWSAAVAGASLLGWAIAMGQNWLTTAAIAFLTGSALIRLTAVHPVLLKLGAVFLFAGGLALAAFGIVACLDVATSLDALTALTGLYVAAAGVLTYVGGVALCHEDHDQGAKGSVIAALMRLTAPLDALAMWSARRIVDPAIFWVGADTKAAKPFTTSMWARLPFRLATATAATLTLTPQGFAFALANLLWAVGDVAIGALDWGKHAPCDVSS